MTAKMIVPNSAPDSTTESVEETSESSGFRQFEFWVNGVKRIIKIPLHSDVELNLEASSQITTVEPVDIDEVLSCSFSADPIVIDPDSNVNDSLCIPLSREESMLTNSVALDAIGRCDIMQSTMPPSSHSNASKTDQHFINVSSPSTTKSSSEWNKKSGQLTTRTDIPVINSYASNSKPLIRGLVVPSTVSENISQHVERASNSKATLIPSELCECSNSNTSLNLTAVGSRTLLQTVNPGTPMIMTNCSRQPLVSNGNSVLPSVSNGSVTYVLQPQLQLNKMTGASCPSSTGAVQPGLTKQATGQCSLMLMNMSKQHSDSVRPQTSNGSNQSINPNLSRFLVLNGQCYNPITSNSSAPLSLHSSSTQVRKVKITTDINGSCIISVNGQTDGSPASSYSDKQTNCNASNVLTAGGVLHGAVPSVVLDGSTFQIMHSNAIQNSQTLQLMPSDRQIFSCIPSNALGSHKPIDLESLSLPSDKASCLKPSNYQSLCLRPVSFASPNVVFQPSCTKQAGLTVQSRASGVLQARGASCVGSVGMLSFCRLPSSMSSVEWPSIAHPAPVTIDSDAVLSRCFPADPPCVPSASLTPVCLPRAISVTGVRSYRNAVFIPPVQNAINATGSSYSKRRTKVRELLRHLDAPFKPPATEFANAPKSGCLISTDPEMSQNLVMSPVTRILCNEFQEMNRVATVSKSSPAALAHTIVGITAPSASGARSISSLLVSSDSALKIPTFPRWSGPAVSKSRNSPTPRSTSVRIKGAFKDITWYPPKGFSQISPAATQNYFSTGDRVSAFVPTTELPTLQAAVSCCPNDTRSTLTLSVAQQPTQLLSDSLVTKSTFSFYNSNLKHHGRKSVQKLIALSTNSHNNTSVNSAVSITSVFSSPSISNVQADNDSSLVPLPVEFYDSIIARANVSKKRKHKSSERSGSANTSTSSLLDAINLLSDPESAISSSESWDSDDSVTIGKHCRRRRLTKRKFCENNKYSTHSFENSELNHSNVERQCFVSLENLYLNGKMSVDVHNLPENLVCCRCPTQRPLSTAYSPKKTVSRKKSYKLNTAVNYISDTD